MSTYLRLLKTGLGIFVMNLMPLDTIKECLLSYLMVCYEYCSELLPLSKRHIDYCLMHCNKILSNKIFELWVDKMKDYLEWMRHTRDSKLMYIFPHEFLLLACNASEYNGVFDRYYSDKKSSGINFFELPSLSIDKLLNQNIETYAQKIFDKEFHEFTEHQFYDLNELKKRKMEEEISKLEEKNMDKLSRISSTHKQSSNILLTVLNVPTTIAIPRDLSNQIETLKKVKVRESIASHLKFTKMMRLMSNGTLLTSTNRENQKPISAKYTMYH